MRQSEAPTISTWIGCMQEKEDMSEKSPFEYKIQKRNKILPLNVITLIQIPIWGNTSFTK